MHNSVRIILIGCLLFFSFSSRADEKERQPFKIAYAESWAPISVDSANTVTGILPELMDIVIDKTMGIPVKHQGFPWARAQEAVRSGEVDAFITTPTPERLKFTRASKNVVFTLNFQPIVRINSDEEHLLKSEKDIYTILKSKKYCDVLGNGWAENFYKAKNLKYLVVPTLDICLKHLAQGQIDIIIHAAPVSLSFIQKLGMGKQLTVLPIVISSSPAFPLLVSNESSFGQDFLNEFDHTVSNMKQRGMWDELLNLSSFITN